MLLRVGRFVPNLAERSSLMRDSRLPTAVYFVLLLFGLLHFAQLYPQLPERIASHFAGDGTPNGWSSKQSFFILIGVITAISAIPTFLVAHRIKTLPEQKINLPNKAYWLSPEHREETYSFFRAFMAWFGCGLLFVLLYGTSLAAKANLSGTGHFDSNAMLYALMAFGLFVVVWLVLFIRHFQNVPSSSDSLR
jgi:uncharacterized membrane protein